MTQNEDREGRSFGGRLRWLWGEGIARRVVVEKGQRRPVDLPLTAFLVAAVLAPWLVALGGVVGIVMGYQFRMEHGGEAEPPAADEPATESGEGTGAG